MPKFSVKSWERLDTCHDDLVLIATEAIVHYDFSVIAGHRGEEEQNKYFREGASKLRFPKSKHNASPSRAIDIYPWHPKYKSLTEDPIVLERIMKIAGCTRAAALAFVREEYCRMAGVIFTVASQVDIKIIWGGDWNSDMDRLDQSFHDLAHFELA